MSDATFESAYTLGIRAAQVHARTAVATGAIPPADREDVMQDAIAACWRTLASFDSTRASMRTYIECVVATRIASAVRSRQRLQAFPPLERAAHRCTAWPFPSLNLQIDLQRVPVVCDDSERQLALLLMEHNPSRVSRVLGVARSTIYERFCCLDLRHGLPFSMEIEHRADGRGGGHD